MIAAIAPKMIARCSMLPLTIALADVVTTISAFC